MDYKNLIVWQKSFLLTKQIYEVSSIFPSAEIYGLSSQLRRASVSIVSNIAEGCSRKSSKEFAQFLSIAFGSTSEVETQLLLAKELGFISQKNFDTNRGLLIEIRKMLVKLSQTIKKK
jgi:four helix bundle protein